MKNFNLLVLLLFFNFSFSQELFVKTNVVDEFGDKIGEVQSNTTTGHFSNSATSKSPLNVKTILEVMPDYTLEEYKNYMVKTYKEQGYSDKEIKKYLKYAENGLKGSKNINGTIRFDLYEYEDTKASLIGIKTGIISIKASNGKKIRASLGEFSFKGNSITITGYKELTAGQTGVKNQIKYGFYDWAQSEIYNEIVNSSEPVQVVIAFGNSTYYFTLE